jgi:hypothetical protein
VKNRPKWSPIIFCHNQYIINTKKKRRTTLRANSAIKKLPKVNNRLFCENTSNLVTLTPDDANCSRFRNHFGHPGSFLPTVWLASYPGSGNTWLRYLIEGYTGFFTRGPDPIVSSFQESSFLKVGGI